jgi:putative acyl-CoA dehydrogenase
MSLLQYAETHEVLNQVPPLDGANLYRLDLPLQDWVRRYRGGWAESRLDAYGALAGGPLVAAGFLANENKPVFKSHDRYGHRIDVVEFHPAYHQLMSAAIAHGIPSLPWTDPQSGAQVARAGLMYLHNQAEAGSSCPLTMTYASVPALRQQPGIADVWLPKILSREYDPRNLPMEQKSGVTIGMAMTEKQGGTDVRANTTRAHAVGAARARPGVRAGRAQVVLLGADVRCLSDPGADRARACHASFCRGIDPMAAATSSISSG